jgi:hypothetical protein
LGQRGGEPHVIGQKMHEEDDKVGVPLTTTMMTLAATTTTTGGDAEMPDRVWDKFEALPKRNGAEFPPLGIAASPLVGMGLARGRGSRNANNGGQTIIAIVGECTKNVRGKGGRNKSLCCVLWADETQALSCEKTRQGPTLLHTNTPLEGIQKKNHIAKPGGQKIQQI